MGQGKLPVRFKRNASLSDIRVLAPNAENDGKIIFANEGGIFIGAKTSGAIVEAASYVTTSSTNGYITANGVDIKVYEHPTATETAAAAVKVGKDAQGHVVLGAALTADDITYAVSYAYLNAWAGSSNLATAKVGTLATAATKAYTETVSTDGANLPTEAAVATYVASYGSTFATEHEGVDYKGTVTGIKLDSSNTVSVTNAAGGVADISTYMAAKANIADTVNNVQYDTENKKITKTIGATVSDVVTASTLLADANGTTKTYVDDELAKKANLAGATFTGAVTFSAAAYSTTLAASTTDTQVATTEFVQNAINAKLTVSDAMRYAGTVNSNSDLPTSCKNGATYKVGTAGQYANVTCEVGDMLIAYVSSPDTTTGLGSPSWSVIQTNIDGAVTGPTEAVVNHIAVFDNASGKVIKDSGFTIATSVPENALFTDTRTVINIDETGTGNAFTLLSNATSTAADGATVYTYTLKKELEFATYSYVLDALNTKADLNSPTFIGTPTAPTVAITGADQTNLATNGAVYTYVGGAIAHMQVTTNMVDAVSYTSKATDKYPSAYAVYNAIEAAVDLANDSIQDLDARIDTLEDDLPSYINKNAFTAKGQLLVGTGAYAYAALAVGENGYALVADSNAASGVKWQSIVGTDFYHDSFTATESNGASTLTLSSSQNFTGKTLTVDIPAAVSDIDLNDCSAGLMTRAEANNLAICVDALTWED